MTANPAFVEFELQASQTSDVCSIPIARSINNDDSTVLTPLTLLKRPIKHGFLVPSRVREATLDSALKEK